MANDKSKKRNRLILVLFIFLAAGGVAGGIYWSKREKPIVIQTDRVARRNLTELVTANGKIQPVVQVVIQPEVSGEIVELPVKEGDQVKQDVASAQAQYRQRSRLASAFRSANNFRW